MTQEDHLSRLWLPSAKPSPSTATALGCCRKPPSLPDSIFQPGAAKNPGRQGQCRAPQSSSSPSACIALQAGEHHLHPRRLLGRSLQQRQNLILFSSGFSPPQSPITAISPSNTSITSPSSQTAQTLLMQFLLSWDFLCVMLLFSCPRQVLIYTTFSRRSVPLLCMHLPQNLNLPNNFTDRGKTAAETELLAQHPEPNCPARVLNTPPQTS